MRKLDFGPAYTDQALRLNFILALIKEGRILGKDNGVSLGRSEEAVAPLQSALTMADNFVHQDPNDQNSRGRLAMAGLLLADILRHSDERRSLSIYDHTLSHTAEVKNNSSFRRFEVSALAGSSYPLLRLGRPAEAGQRLDAAFTRLSQLDLYPAERIGPGSEADKTLRALADYEAARGGVGRAIEIYEELLRKVLAWQPKPDTSLAGAVDLSRVYAALAGLYRRTGRNDLASALEARRLELWRGWDARLPDSNFVRRQLNAASGPVE